MLNDKMENIIDIRCCSQQHELAACCMGLEILVAQIMKELYHSEIISILFLISEDPQWLLRLLEAIPKSRWENIVIDWASTSPTGWRETFVEALLVCQRFDVIRKLRVPNADNLILYYSSDVYGVHYLRPINKILYKLCDNMTSHNVKRLRDQLGESVDTRHCDSAEEIILKMINSNIINIDLDRCNLHPLVLVLHDIPALDQFASELCKYQNMCEANRNLTADKTGPQNSVERLGSGEAVVNVWQQIAEKYYEAGVEASKCEDCGQNSDGSEAQSMDPNITAREAQNDLLCTPKKSSTVGIDRYPIQNHDRTGVCLIINQFNFYNVDNHNNNLTNRAECLMDMKALSYYMKKLKFEVKYFSNLCHESILSCIEDVIETNVTKCDSIFQLYIFSHGVRDHIFGADSVKVNVENIQDLVSYKLKNRGLEKVPKMFIIEACQSDEPGMLIGTKLYNASGNDFLVIWSAIKGSDSFQAYDKATNKCIGSIFLKAFLKMMNELSATAHMYEIHTAVNSYLQEKLPKSGIQSECRSTLKKLLYLQ